MSEGGFGIHAEQVTRMEATRSVLVMEEMAERQGGGKEPVSVGRIWVLLWNYTLSHFACGTTVAPWPLVGFPKLFCR